MISAMGYEGVYQKKTRESMGMEGKVDGCALFYRKTRYCNLIIYPFTENWLKLSCNEHRFYLKEQYTLEFNEAANDFIASLLASFDLAYPNASNHDREV